jgi:nicotinamidase-related amidase
MFMLRPFPFSFCPQYFWAALSETVPRWKKLLTACRASGVEVSHPFIHWIPSRDTHVEPTHPAEVAGQRDWSYGCRHCSDASTYRLTDAMSVLITY